MTDDPGAASHWTHCVCVVRGHHEWMTVDVPATSWWEVIDHPEALARGLHGWEFASCTSGRGDGTAVLTYYRPAADSRPQHDQRSPSTRKDLCAARFDRRRDTRRARTGH
jgi:hypothetical protein